MRKVKDMSGPFDPNLTLEDLSKDFLLKLIHVWQYAWLHMSEAWYYAVKERFGVQAANHCELAAWIRVGERVNPRYAKVGNIQLNTVLDSLKALQLPLDNIASGLYQPEFDIKSHNHVVMTIRQCRSLLFFEEEAPERIDWVCHVVEKQVLEKYLVNPNIKVTALKLPPRKSPNEIACQWELELEG